MGNTYAKMAASTPKTRTISFKKYLSILEMDYEQTITADQIKDITQYLNNNQLRYTRVNVLTAMNNLFITKSSALCKWNASYYQEFPLCSENITRIINNCSVIRINKTLVRCVLRDFTAVNRLYYEIFPVDQKFLSYNFLLRKLLAIHNGDVYLPLIPLYYTHLERQLLYWKVICEKLTYVYTDQWEQMFLDKKFTRKEISDYWHYELINWEANS